MSGSSQRLVLPALFALVLITSLLASPILAESEKGFEWNANEAKFEASSDDDDDSESGQPAARPGYLDKLQIHGFLTQAYAEGTFVKGGVPGPSGLERSLGIPEDGTTDYRSMALQFRYEITPSDIVVVQFSSRALGFSPAETLEDEIELDWAFYERLLTDSTSLKVGRVQIPIGIYNEIRDVGTILPFYRPPFGWYAEGSFTSETLDGLVLSNTFFQESDWGLDFEIYYGEWTEVEFDPTDPTRADIARASDAYGLQLWLNTPISGLRFGAGGYSKRLSEGSPFIRPQNGFKTPDSEQYHLSLDASLNRFTFRSEYRELDSIVFLPFVDIFVTTTSFYAQAGVNVTEKFQIWLQYDDVDLSGDSAIHSRPEDNDFRTDTGISLNYRFSPNLVLKAEYHETEEEQQTNVIVPGPGGLILIPSSVKADDGNYTIISLSVSF